MILDERIEQLKEEIEVLKAEGAAPFELASLEASLEECLSNRNAFDGLQPFVQLAFIIHETECLEQRYHDLAIAPWVYGTDLDQDFAYEVPDYTLALRMSAEDIFGRNSYCYVLTNALLREFGMNMSQKIVEVISQANQEIDE